MQKEGSESHFNTSTSSNIPPALGNPTTAAPAGQSPYPSWMLTPSGVQPGFPIQHSLQQSYPSWMAGNPFGSSAYSTLSRTDVSDAYGTLPRELQAALAAHGGVPMGTNPQTNNPTSSSNTGQLYVAPSGQVSLSGFVSPAMSPPFSPTGQPSQQQNLSRALETYSANLLRSQLEQAQQQAQVCVVPLFDNCLFFSSCSENKNAL